MQRIVKRTLCLFLSLLMLLTAVPLQGLAKTLTAEKPTVLNTENGEVNVGDDWEITYPYGTFVFENSEAALKEGGETAEINVYRLGGATGRATAIVRYNPAVTPTSESTYGYATAISTNDIEIEAEDPQPIAQYQPVGKKPDPEKGVATVVKAEEGGDYILSLSREATLFQWQTKDGGKWRDVTDAVGATFTVAKKDYDSYDFRCVYEINDMAFCTDSVKGELYEKTEEVLPEMPDDIELEAEPTYTKLEPDETDPYAAYQFNLVFADGEWMKTIRVTPLEDDLSECVEIGAFVIEDCEGGTLNTAANTLTFTVTDNDPPEPFELGVTETDILADKAAGVAYVTVKRTGGFQEAVTIKYETEDGDAVQGVDYQATSGELVFYGNITQLPIEIPLIDDGIATDQEKNLTLKLTELKGDSENVCTLTETKANVRLVNSGTGEGKNLATTLTDPEAVDLSGTVKETAESVVDVDPETVTGEQVVPEELTAQIAGFNGSGEQLRTFNYGEIGFTRGENYSGWDDTYDLNYSGSHDPWSLDGVNYVAYAGFYSKSPGSATLVIDHMAQKYSGINATLFLEALEADGWTRFWYGKEGTYSWFNVRSGGNTLASKSSDYWWDDGHIYCTWHQQFDYSWSMNSGADRLVFGFSHTNDDHDAQSAPRADFNYRSVLNRRVFDKKLKLAIHTANDGAQATVPTAPTNAAQLNPSFSSSNDVYAQMMPDISIVEGQGGVNGDGMLFVGSKIKVTLKNTDSYKPFSGEQLSAAVYIARSDGRPAPVKVEGSGNEYYFTFLWDGMTEADLTDSYTLNVVMTRTQGMKIDLSANYPRDDEEIPEGKTKMDCAVNLFNKGLDYITVGYSAVTNEAPHFEKSVITKQIAKAALSPNGGWLIADNIKNTTQNIQYINFNCGAEDRILLNGRMFKGNEDIWLSTKDLASSTLTFYYYNEKYLSARSAMHASIDKIGLYCDMNGNGKIDGVYDDDIGYFVLDETSGDEFVMFLEPNENYYETIFNYIAKENGSFAQMYLKFYYNMNPRALTPEPGEENEVAQVMPALTTSVTDPEAYALLTEEQKSYRVLVSGMNADGTYSSDGHPMFGAATTATQTVDVPLGGDTSPVTVRMDGDNAVYEWTPKYRGNLLYPFSDPSQIVIETSIVAERVPLAPSLENGGSLSDTDRENLNGYLGSLVASTTVALCVRQQQKTTAQLIAEAGSRGTRGTGDAVPVDQENPYESAAVSYNNTLPDASGEARVSSDKEAAGDFDMENSGNSLDMLNLGFKTKLPKLDLSAKVLSFSMKGDQIIIGISLPIGSLSKETDVTPGGQGMAPMQGSHFGQQLKKMGNDFDTAKTMLNNNVPREYAAGTIDKSVQNRLQNSASGFKKFAVAFSFYAGLILQYDSVTNHFEVQKISVAFITNISFSYTARFAPCPLIYVCITLGFTLSLGTNWSKKQTITEATPLIGKQVAADNADPDTVSIAANAYRIFPVTSESLKLRFKGKISLRLYKEPACITPLSPGEETLYADKTATVSHTLSLNSGVTFGSDKYYLMVSALEDSQLSRLACLKDGEEVNVSFNDLEKEVASIPANTYRVFPVTSEALNLQFKGKISLRLYKEPACTTALSPVGETLTSDGANKLPHTLTLNAGVTFDSNEYYYLKVSALEDTQISHLACLRNSKEYTAPVGSIKLNEREYRVYPIKYKSLNLKFNGRIDLELFEDAACTKLVKNCVKGYVTSNGNKSITVTVFRKNGYTFEDDQTYYLRVYAEKETTIFHLASITNVKNELTNGGFEVAPSLMFQIAAGVGVELMKFEIAFKVAASYSFSLFLPGGPDFRSNLLTLYAGLSFNAVFLLFSFSYELLGYTVTYNGDYWTHSINFVGWDAYEGATRGGVNYDAALSLPGDAEKTQTVYRQQEEKPENVRGFDPSDERVPFELSGYSSSADAVKLADGLLTGYDYKVVPVKVGDHEENYVLYHIGREGDHSAVDNSMLVLSRLKMTGVKGGLVNPVDESSPVPWVAVEDDGTGDLGFHAEDAGNGKLRIAWVNYASAGTGEGASGIEAFRAAAENVQIRTTEFTASAVETTQSAQGSTPPEGEGSGQTGAITGDPGVAQTSNTAVSFTGSFSAAKTVSGDAANVSLPAFTDDAVIYVRANPISETELNARTELFRRYLASVGMDTNSEDDVEKSNAFYRISTQRGKWVVSGGSSDLCVSLGGGAQASVALADGVTVENIETAKIEDTYYIAYTTSETLYTDKNGNTIDVDDSTATDETLGGIENMLTVKRLYLRTFTVADGVVTWGQNGKAVLLRTLYDFDDNEKLNDDGEALKDGLYVNGAVEPSEDPYFSNLHFLNAKLGNAITGETESFTLRGGEIASEEFLLFDMNGATYLIRQASLKSIASAQSGSIIPFFKAEAPEAEEGTSTATGRGETVIGADGDGNLAAVFTSSVANTSDNALCISKFDPVTGAWGSKTVLAMNHLNVYEDNTVKNRENKEAVNAYLGLLKDENGNLLPDQDGSMNQFVFSNPQIALGNKSVLDENGDVKEYATLLVLTQGAMTYYTENTGEDSEEIPAIPVKASEVYEHPEQYPGSDKAPAGVGVYALAYGVGAQGIGEAQLTMPTYDFSAGASEDAYVRFVNTGDVGIRGSRTQPITVSLLARYNGNEQTLAQWTVTENILPGQEVSLSGVLSLSETLPEGAEIHLRVAEDTYYADQGGSAYTQTTEDPLLTVRSCPELDVFDESVSLASVDENGNAVLNVDFTVGNRGIAAANGVTAVFSYQTEAVEEGGETHYERLDLTGCRLEHTTVQLTRGAGSDLPNGEYALGDIAVGYGEHVTGSITVPARNFQTMNGTSLGLKIEAFSSADKALDEDGVFVSGVHDEYNCKNNSIEASIAHETMFEAPARIYIPMGNTVRIPVSFHYTEDENDQKILITELPDQEGNTHLGVCSYRAGSSVNGSGKGTVVLSPRGEGSGIVRLLDAGTNSFFDIAFTVTSPADGINIFKGNDMFTFYNSENDPYDASAEAYTQNWLFDEGIPAWGADMTEPYLNDLARGKVGASFTFKTQAQSIDLVFDGTVTVTSDFPGFGSRSITASGGSGDQSDEYATVYFGLNESNQTHTVTVTVTKPAGSTKYANFDRLIEHFNPSGGVPVPADDENAPHIYYSRSFPEADSLRDDGTPFPLQAFILDDGGIADVKLNGKTPESITKTRDGFWTMDLAISENGEYVLEATDDAGNVTRHVLEVDWFNSAADGSETNAVPTLNAKLMKRVNNGPDVELTGDVPFQYGDQAYITASGRSADGASDAIISVTGVFVDDDDEVNSYAVNPDTAGEYPAVTSGWYVVRAADPDPDSAGWTQKVLWMDKLAAKTLIVTLDAKTKYYGDEDPALTYSVVGLVPGDSVTVEPSRKEGTDVGEYLIDAKVTPSVQKKYTVVVVTANLTIQPRPITVVADAQTKTYGDPDPEFTYTVTGLLNNDTLSGALGRDPDENVGTYEITLGSLGNPNYDIQYAPAQLTITKRLLTVTADPFTKVYGDHDPELTYRIEGLASWDRDPVSIYREQGEDAGTYDIIADINAGGNYVVDFTGAAFTITPKPLTVVADPKAKTYGDADPELTYVATGLVAYDVITGALAREAGESIGTYAIGLGTVSAGPNYAIDYTGADLTIGKKTLNITADPISKTYHETDPALTYKVEGLEPGDRITGTLERAAGEDAGEYAVSLGTLSAGDNYEINFTGSVFTIAQKEVTVTVDAKSKVYGAEDPELTCSVVGMVEGDDISVILTREPGENAGTYAINADISVSDNYKLIYIPAAFTIQKHPLTVTIWSNSKTEGEKDPKLQYKIEGLLEGEHIGVKLTREPGEAIGEYAINAEFTGAENYDITIVSGTFRIHSKLCPLCGKEHNGNIFDKIVGFFHKIIYTFKSFFSGFSK